MCGSPRDLSKSSLESADRKADPPSREWRSLFIGSKPGNRSRSSRVAQPWDEAKNRMPAEKNGSNFKKPLNTVANQRRFKSASRTESAARPGRPACDRLAAARFRAKPKGYLDTITVSNDYVNIF